LRAINDRPYEEPKHPYESQPKRGIFCFFYILILRAFSL
jgi:hypothetical protein